ncbi:aldehyde dehydrogenase family protein [Limoniibacter endophyticus]|uniref:Aldehyde dehydrogenase n=1 Tax=Limoniibacter endophyticus TaxID=1565040 RepID=A0A8J3GF15_9HYPH|nr:aldehyde dehydrogenase family protein [Limoniibacter endophyticus]GHC64036.1 aldehyde dehydrogenase [Limoniibacter endophyticus]
MSVKEYFETMDYAAAPESEKPAREWLEKNGHAFGHFIDGRFTAHERATAFGTVAPASGKVLASINQGTAADIDAAVKAANKAQKKWAALSGHARARHLYALARSIQRHARLIAIIEALDNGKPIREARDIDVPLAVRHFYHHAGWAQLQDKEFPDHAPVGVVGQIVPWNFPFLMLAWKVAPALALGNTVVLKPAEQTSLTAMFFAGLARTAGLPRGVLNIVTGDGTTGEALVRHADVHKIAFTGSTAVGRLIREVTAGSGKSLTLELGGKSPFIVFDDADLDAAVEGVVDSIWFNQGEVCCAGSRLLMHEAIAERFTRMLAKRLATLRTGDSLDKSIDIGAMISARDKVRVEELIAQGVREGAMLHQAPQAAGDAYVAPTLLSGISPASSLMAEEIFGPVVVSTTFRTPDEAAQLANHTRYGLAASIWSQTLDVALDMANRVEAGVVWINSANSFDAAVGFGGQKESGFGVEGGREGCFEYLKPRAWINAKPRKAPPGRKSAEPEAFDGLPPIDRTPKLFIGGKQTRPDSGLSFAILNADGKRAGEVGEGSRKDIRDAVAAARKAESWTKASAHNRAQVLYYLAENLAARGEEFARRLKALSGNRKSADIEIATAISRLFTYAAYADKFEGNVHAAPVRGLVYSQPEALGVAGIVCPPEAPLLSTVSLMTPLLAMGNRVVLVPHEESALIATDLYPLLETSDVPAGVVNIVTGKSAALAQTLADHDDVDGLWAFGDADLATLVENRSAGNLKRIFTDYGMQIDWLDGSSEGEEFLRRAVKRKSIWVPYGA